MISMYFEPPVLPMTGAIMHLASKNVLALLRIPALSEGNLHVPKAPPTVFLDANVIIQTGKPPGGPIMSRVADLVRADLIEVLTTDLTVTEVVKKHVENDYEAIKAIGRRHFRNLVGEHLG